jgi:hypothetical protein
MVERQQNIRQASIRMVGKNHTLSGLPIDQNNSGGDIIMLGGGPDFCKNCGFEKAPGISCCGIE